MYHNHYVREWFNSDLHILNDTADWRPVEWCEVDTDGHWDQEDDDDDDEQLWCKQQFHVMHHY